MNVARVLTDYLDALANTRLALRSPSVLVPFVLFGALQVVILTFLAFFHWPPVAPAAVPLVGALGGEGALHYPMHFVLLPRLYEWIYLPLAATLGFPLWTFAVWTMVEHHEVGRSVPHRPFRSLLPGIIGVGAAFVAVSAGLGRAMGVFSGAVSSGLAARTALAVGVMLVAVAQTFLVYAPVALRIRPVGALGAIRVSARYALRRFWPTFLVVGTVLAVHGPLDAMIRTSHRMVMAFHPEIVYYIMLGSVGVEALTAYALFSAVVGLALAEEGGMH